MELKVVDNSSASPVKNSSERAAQSELMMIPGPFSNGSYGTMLTGLAEPAEASISS